jgi:adenylate cyclase class 2
MAQAGQETEVKFHVRRLAELPARILALGGRLRSTRSHELNLRFDAPDGRLRRAGHVLRLRRDAAVQLTFKDKSRLHDGIRSRREIELGAADFDTARQFLEALGYVVIFTYEKFRTTYELESLQIMLDELPLGGFVELEGPPESLKAAAAKLGLRWQAAVPRSYHELFQQAQRVRALPFSDLTFSNFKGMPIQPSDLALEPADE